MKYTVTFYGQIQPAHRPRAAVIGGKPRMHNDPRHTAWMKSIREQCGLFRALLPKEPITGPVSLRLVFYLAKPKTVKRACHTVKPDLSNLCKAVEDALNGIAWVDDSQIVDLKCSKWYSTGVSNESVTVIVSEITAEQFDAYS